MGEETAIGGPGGAFPATRLSAVRAARSSDPRERQGAFDALAAVYWKPIYKYLRLRWRRSNEDAKDLTQEFFLRLVEKDVLAGYQPDRARLRTYLRTCLDRMVHNHDRDARRLKRGGDRKLLPMDFVAAEAELAHAAPPASEAMEDYFEREWVRSLFSLAVDDLEADCERRGRALDFQLFERYDLREEPPTYGALARELEVTESTVTNRLAAARRVFRRCVLDRLHQMAGSDEEFRFEARSVLGVTSA
jgi:RNA polymerase sigma factor (sigma-70 family)